MKNRPGRIFYSINYKGLEQSFILEYCRDNLLDQSHCESVARIGSIFPSLNFDTLKALVEEMNRYGESPDEALQMLNANPDSGESASFTPTLVLDGTPVLTSDTWTGNPVRGRVIVHFEVDADQKPALKNWFGSEAAEDDLYSMVAFNLDDLVRIDPNTGHFEFDNKKGARLLLEKQQPKTTIWRPTTWAPWPGCWTNCASRSNRPRPRCAASCATPPRPAART